MVSITKIDYVGSKPIFYLYGKSTDVKPVNPQGCEGRKLTNGSELLLDNSTVWKFNEDTNDWSEL